MRGFAPTILALDTSTHAIGIALMDNAQVHCEHTWLSQDYHTVELAPMVEQALLRSQIQKEHLCALAVAIGPGSFTGLRIGLALAKGMALALHIPIIGIPTLDILAASQPKQETNLLCLLRAGRTRLAMREYSLQSQGRIAKGDYEVHPIQDILDKITDRTWICGELNPEERQILAGNPFVMLASPPQCVRRPAQLAALAWQRWQQGKFDDPISLSPIYLHYNDPISI